MLRPMDKRAAILLALSPILSGCLASRLASPAQDHAVQTAAILVACKTGGYGEPCHPDLVEDLEAMSEQACLIEAVTLGEGPETCGGYGVR